VRSRPVRRELDLERMGLERQSQALPFLLGVALFVLGLMLAGAAVVIVPHEDVTEM
jgi:hypothetical protein